MFPHLHLDRSHLVFFSRSNMVMGWPCLVSVTSKFQARTKELAGSPSLTRRGLWRCRDFLTHCPAWMRRQEMPLPLGSSPGFSTTSTHKIWLDNHGVIIIATVKDFVLCYFVFRIPSPSLRSQTETVMRGQECIFYHVSFQNTEITLFFVSGWEMPANPRMEKVNPWLLT